MNLIGWKSSCDQKLILGTKPNAYFKVLHLLFSIILFTLIQILWILSIIHGFSAITTVLALGYVCIWLEEYPYMVKWGNFISSGILSSPGISSTNYRMRQVLTPTRCRITLRNVDANPCHPQQSSNSHQLLFLLSACLYVPSCRRILSWQRDERDRSTRYSADDDGSLVSPLVYEKKCGQACWIKKRHIPCIYNKSQI